jgi:hypothetical protein
LFPSKISTIDKICNENGINFINPNINKRENLLSSIKSDNKVNLIYHDNNIIIVQVFDTDSIQKYGSKSWCIKNKNSWEEYVGRKNSQYLVWNFNYHFEYDWHLLGFTIRHRSCKFCECDYKSKVKYIYDMVNDEVWNSDNRSYHHKFNKENFKYITDGEDLWPVKAYKIIKKSRNNIIKNGSYKRV